MSNDNDAERKQPILKPRTSKALIDDDGVADYLLTDPDFFERHPGLLLKLTVRHPTGDAVSLIERQVELLRSQNQTLERRLVDMVEVARGNDSVLKRLHALSVALLGTADPRDQLRVLEDHMKSQFGADRTRFLLFATHLKPQRKDSIESVDRDELAEFTRFLEEGQPYCGRLRPVQLEFLFGKQAAKTKSAALIPIGTGVSLGLLALGSNDADHFSPTLGTVFLTRIGELAEQIIKPLPEK